jgi:predicted RNA-binding Zn-ribbon protein involved in translation (DUF1610 family)
MAKMILDCLECGAKFKVALEASDPRCPGCGSVDYEVSGLSFLAKEIKRAGKSSCVGCGLEIAGDAEECPDCGLGVHSA